MKIDKNTTSKILHYLNKISFLHTFTMQQINKSVKGFSLRFAVRDFDRIGKNNFRFKKDAYIIPLGEDGQQLKDFRWMYCIPASQVLSRADIIGSANKSYLDVRIASLHKFQFLPYDMLYRINLCSTMEEVGFIYEIQIRERKKIKDSLQGHMLAPLTPEEAFKPKLPVIPDVSKLINSGVKRKARPKGLKYKKKPSMKAVVQTMKTFDVLNELEKKESKEETLDFLKDLGDISKEEPIINNSVAVKSEFDDLSDNDKKAIFSLYNAVIHSGRWINFEDAFKSATDAFHVYRKTIKRK